MGFLLARVSMTQNQHDIQLPEEIINAYRRAKRHYINLEERYQRWARRTLEDFQDALKNVAQSATQGETDIGRDRKLAALEHLTYIYDRSVRVGGSTLPAPTSRCVLPNHVLELHDAALTAYLRYALAAKKPKGAFISRFRDALDHIVDSADPDTPEASRPYLMAQIEEHLLEAAAESYQIGAVILRKRAIRALSIRRLIWSGLPGRLETEKRL